MRGRPPSPIRALSVNSSSIASAGKAYSALHDIDANKPSGSIKIRVKTYAHTLMLLREKLEDQALKQVELDQTIVKSASLPSIARRRGSMRSGCFSTSGSGREDRPS